jgi:aspartate/methionine/tyrosine aminotransferase
MTHPHHRTSLKAEKFTESVIREMSRLATRYDAVNLAQGIPDFAAPRALKEAACDAILHDVNQYAITWGDRGFREAIAQKTKRTLGLTLDPEREITVTCGATEAMVAVLMATINPGDEVIIFEPFYENYGPDVILAGASPRYISLHAPDWSFDEQELRQAFNDKTRAIIINTPHNPTGKVFSRDELQLIADLCQQWDVLAVTDEIYEHILYDDTHHIAMATLPDMANRTITINGMSKTYSVTGWRVGYILAAPDLTNAIRKVHDFLTVGSPAPLQRAGITAMNMPESYYNELAQTYAEKRNRMTQMLNNAGVKYYLPKGAYYIFADIGGFGYKTDVEFTHYLVKDVGVAVVPGSSFFHRAENGHRFIRFCYSKQTETLEKASQRLLKLKETLRLPAS